MQKLLLFITTTLLLVTNSYYSTYGILVLLAFTIFETIKNKTKPNKLTLLANTLLILSYLFSGIKALSLEPTLLLLLLVNNLSSIKIDKYLLAKLSKYLTILFFILGVYQLLSTQFAYGPFINIFNTKEIYPNAFAALNLLLLPLNKGKIQSLNIFNILISKSRIGIIVTGLFYIYKIIVNKRNSKKFIILGLMLILLPTALINKTSQSTEFSSLDQRIEHWQNSPKLLNNIKVIALGYGANSFSYIYPTVQQIPENQAPHSHNLIINLAVENGLLFTALLILMLIKRFKKLDGQYKAALLLFLIHNLVDLNIQFPLTIFILLLIFNTESKSENAGSFISLSMNIFAIVILLMSMSGNFYYGHKDELLRNNNQSSLTKYIQENPLDSKQLLKLDEKKYIKEVFEADPYSVDHLVTLLKYYPETQLDPEWLEHYKEWYVSHSKYNLNYIHEKGTVEKLKNTFKLIDPEFANSL